MLMKRTAMDYYSPKNTVERLNLLKIVEVVE
jgi:hypothetical protein